MDTKFLIVILGVLVGGILGKVAKIPSGALIGGVVGGLLVKVLISGQPKDMPTISFFAQVFVACVLVSSADVSSVKKIPGLLPFAFLYSFVILAFSMIFAFILLKVYKIDIITSIFAVPPGGITGIGLIATEAGVDIPVMITFHLIRITVVLLTVPFIAKWLSG